MHYIVTPARLTMQGVPHPAGGLRPVELPADAKGRMPGTLDIDGLSTRPTNIQAAKHLADELLKAYRAKVDGGRPAAILELLDLNPEFIQCAWVREAYVNLAEAELRRGRGRPKGRYKINPMVVVGVVEHLIETRRAANRERAFAWLEENGLMQYVSAKDSFYRAAREQRFKSMFQESPEFAQTLSQEQGAAWLRGVEILKPGGTIKRRWNDPERGVVELELRGL